MFRSLLVLPIFFTTYLIAGDIENPQTPAGQAMTLKFTQDLRIGPDDGDEAFIWSGINVFVDANAKGHMFISDSAENRIVELDPSGALVKIHGRKGQGPGEFETLSRFQILADGTGLAFENRHSAGIHFYNDNMVFQKRKRMRSQGYDFIHVVFSPDGKYMAGDFVLNNNQAARHSFRSGVYTQMVLMKKMISEQTIAMPDFNKLLNDMQGIVDYLGGVIKANDLTALMAFDNQGRLYTAKPKQYEVTIWDPSLKEVQATISREYKPITKTEAELDAICEAIHDQLPFPDFVLQRITPAMIRDAYEKAEVPLIKSAIFGLIPMEQDGFLAVHDFNQSDGKATANIFDGEGAYLGDVTMPNLAFVGGANVFGSQKVRMTFRNGFAYTVETVDDENVLVRYKYERVPAK